MSNNDDDLASLVRKFFEIMDREEESDSLNVFRPTYISSCRTMTIQELEVLIPAMRKAASDG
jgi:hypothetical protein